MHLFNFWFVPWDVNAPTGKLPRVGCVLTFLFNFAVPKDTQRSGHDIWMGGRRVSEAERFLLHIRSKDTVASGSCCTSTCRTLHIHYELTFDVRSRLLLHDFHIDCWTATTWRTHVVGELCACISVGLPLVNVKIMLYYYCVHFVPPLACIGEHPKDVRVRVSSWSG